MNATRLSISVLSLSSLLGPYAVAQDKKKADSSQRETVARPMTEKERRKKEEKLRKELETPYRKWLNEDVAYIITDEERTAFKRLQTDEEREQFIEQFWLRRDPTPDSIENEFKEEHYRRIAKTSLPAFPGGRPIAAASILLTARRMKKKPTRRAAPTSGLRKKAAAPHPPSPSSSGAIGISKASAATSLLNSSIPPCPASTA